MTLGLKKAQRKKSYLRNKLYSRYTHLGAKNFITYGLRAAKKMDNSKTIRRQLKPLWQRFHEEINRD